jgi:hypothetical protein
MRIKPTTPVRILAKGEYVKIGGQVTTADRAEAVVAELRDAVNFTGYLEPERQIEYEVVEAGEPGYSTNDANRVSRPRPQHDREKDQV